MTRKPVQVQDDEEEKEKDNEGVRMFPYSLVWDILVSESPYRALIICSSHL